MTIVNKEYPIEEIEVNSKLKIYSFKTGEKIKRCFLYIPSFNYSALDAIKFFNNDWFDNDETLFVTFDFTSKIYKNQKKMKQFVMDSLLTVLSWIVSLDENIKIYLLAESWSCAIAAEFCKEYHQRFEKLILWNFPSSEKFLDVFRENKNIHTMEVKNKNEKVKILNGYKFNTDIYDIYSKKFVLKLMQFNLVNVDSKYEPFLKDIDNLFNSTWKYLYDNNPDNKINIIESSDDSLKSEYLQKYADLWKDNIHYIEGKHLALMNFEKNKNLFNKINEIVEN